ncbi:MAG: 50S ribosomal protein L4 [Verrucomicrobiae bacterium]|nr:50S ribosomal protein L4 [Verrucomicrobiae bacterium]
MKLTVQDLQGTPQGEVEVPFPVIENGKGTQAVHDVVVAYLAAQRSGTACTKTMGEVAGTGKKPWRQKGTGRARAGSFQSPLWRGGGIVFGPKPRDFHKKVNETTRRLALRKALSERIKASEVIVVDELKLAQPKTRELVRLLDTLAPGVTVLLVTDSIDQNLRLAARNLPHVELVTGTELNCYQALKPAKIVFTRAALAQVGQRLSQS